MYSSKGYYTDWKLPQLVPKDSIFAFTDFFISKKNSPDSLPEKRLLKEFSDGEHQFIHSMGICIMLKERRTLLLLDEPETHLNPAWRAKFIKTLADSIEASRPIQIKKMQSGSVEIEVQPSTRNLDYYVNKEILLTSHSPFIISDCLPHNVVLFEKNQEGNVVALKVNELDESFNTFGCSVEIILERLFGFSQSIGDLANNEIEKIDVEGTKTKDQVDKAKMRLRRLGESIEKDMVLARLKKIELAS